MRQNTCCFILTDVSQLWKEMMEFRIKMEENKSNARPFLVLHDIIYWINAFYTGKSLLFAGTWNRLRWFESSAEPRWICWTPQQWSKAVFLSSVRSCPHVFISLAWSQPARQLLELLYDDCNVQLVRRLHGGYVKWTRPYKASNSDWRNMLGVQHCGFPNMDLLGSLTPTVDQDLKGKNDYDCFKLCLSLFSTSMFKTL